MRSVALLVLTLILLLSLMGSAFSSGGTALDWSVTASGGGHAEAGNLSLDSTIGQPVIGTTGNGDAVLCAGFWCRVTALFHTYFPVLLRNSS
ncbi:MAG: hypothetical protein M3220_12130 [Chloroflexota bacterium]|nr:hypothetical protein [Chloroflexota bacterium]